MSTEDAVAAIYEGHPKRFDSIERRLESLEAGLADFRREANQRFDSLERDVADVKQRLDKVETKLDLVLAKLDKLG